LQYILQVCNNTFSVIVIFFVPSIIFAIIIRFTSMAIFKRLSKVIGIKTYIYMTAPGTVVHELGHAIFCLLFRHHINEMKLFSPEPDGTLGYVNHSYNPKSAYQRVGNFFIATGPIWLGSAVIFVVSLILAPDTGSSKSLTTETGFEVIVNSVAIAWHLILSLFSLSFWCTWESYLWLYLIFAIGTNISLSKQDVKGAWNGFIASCICIFVINLILTVFVKNQSFIVLFYNFLTQIYAILIYVLVLQIIIAIIISFCCKKRI